MLTNIDHMSDILNALSLEHGSKHYTEVIHWTNTALNMAREIYTQMSLFTPWSEGQFDRLLLLLKNYFPNDTTIFDTHVKDLASNFYKIKLAKEMPHFYLEKIKKFQELMIAVRPHFPNQNLPPELDSLFNEITASLNDAHVFSQQYLSRLNELAKRYNDMAMSFDFILATT
jgi:hypothetical protein